MYKELENNQILIQEKGDTYELWRHFGMKYEVKIEEVENMRIYQWMKFDLNLEKYICDAENSMPILIDNTEYIPVNGRVELPI